MGCRLTVGLIGRDDCKQGARQHISIEYSVAVPHLSAGLRPSCAQPSSSCNSLALASAALHRTAAAALRAYAPLRIIVAAELLIVLVYKSGRMATLKRRARCCECCECVARVEIAQMCEAEAEE